MTFAALNSRGQDGLQAQPVTVEVYKSPGLPRFDIVGLAATAVKESRDRVRATLQNLNYTWPQSRMTVNLAPADMPKEGGRFDLAIALGVLSTTRALSADVQPYEFVGELGIDGTLRPVQAILPAALACRDAGRRLVCPVENAAEAALVPRGTVIAAGHLEEVLGHLHGNCPLQPITAAETGPTITPSPLDLNEVKGQALAKRALTIAASGGHNVLFLGPPGSGKSMLAARLPGLLPPLSEEEAVAVAAIRSIAGERAEPARFWEPPYRNPHHTVSAPALVGGGSKPKPGEVSLAHHGVLFLDELGEFRRGVLESLRQPLENGEAVVARAQGKATFPARFLLIAAMNPCPCGYRGDSSGRCDCTPSQVQRYLGRISGPVLDRFDLHVELPRQGWQALQASATDAASTAEVRTQVSLARKRQLKRQQALNRDLPGARVNAYCDAAAQRLLRETSDRRPLSARSLYKIMRVARTIADLAGDAGIQTQHIAEALALRCLDRATR